MWCIFSHGYLPDSFLTSLRGKVIYAADHSLFLSGDSIADSVRSYCLRVFDPRLPASCSSRDGNSIIPFVCSLLGVAVPSPSVAVGDSDAHSSRVSFASFPSSFSFPVTSVASVYSDFSLPFATSSLSAPSFPGLVAGSLPGLVASSVSWPVTSSVTSRVAPVVCPVSRSVSFTTAPPVVWPVASSFILSAASSVAGSGSGSLVSCVSPLVGCPPGGSFSSAVAPSVA